MSIPVDLTWLASVASNWVNAQRDRYRPLGRSLIPHEIAVLKDFFDAAALTAVRIHTVSKIENPFFYAALPPSVTASLIDFTAMAGITFDNTIVIASGVLGTRAVAMRLLFHELVHVVQYRELGVDGFLGQYVLGWAKNGYQYSGIPLEREAYDMDARFTANPESSFSVEAIVRRSQSAQIVHP
jgi:hypothetical protein